MKRTALNVSYEAYHSGTSGSGSTRYLIPQRDFIVIPRTTYIVPLLEDMEKQCQPHGLGVLCCVDGRDIFSPWRIVPAYSVDCPQIAAKLAYQRGGQFWDSWLQQWATSNYQPPKAAYNRQQTRLADLIAAIGT